MPDEQWMRPRYRSRSELHYFEDEDRGVVSQPDVYTYAALIAKELGASVLIDVGCGRGDKLVACAGSLRTIGIDHGGNLDRARARYPDRDWRSHDLSMPGPLPLSAAEAAGAVLVCSDVIEHVPDARVLLGTLRASLTGAAALILSTPERDLLRGLAHTGPPQNLSHVREWTLRELGALMHDAGFTSLSTGLTRSDDHDHAPNTTLIVATNDPQTTRRCAAVLVDASPVVMPPDRSTLPWRIRRALRLVIVGY